MIFMEIDKELEEARERLKKKEKPAKKEEPEEKEKGEEIEEKLEPAEENFAEFEMSRARGNVHAPVLTQSEETGGSLDSMFTPSLKKEDEEKGEGPRYSIQQEIKKYERNELIRAEALTPRGLGFDRRFEEGMRPVKRQEEWRGGGERTDMIKYSLEKAERVDLPFMKKEKGNIREAKKYYE